MTSKGFPRDCATKKSHEEIDQGVFFPSERGARELAANGMGGSTGFPLPHPRRCQLPQLQGSPLCRQRKTPAENEA